MICDNVLEAVGSTPLVRLRRMTGPDDAQVLVKFEAVNVGGSVKTRTALKMVERAEERGELTPDSVIVEPTSGNQGVGLALVAAVVADGYFFRQACGVDVVRQALGGAADGVDIHAVGACADDAAQTGGAELQGHGKAVLNGGIVPLNAFQLGLEVCVIQLGSQPTLIHILIHK